ncbi:hypothetical protein NESM_000117800 [Novymonas esmeraldas]|uniref:START domain-containing protein n=1 Tax=Novymonas esmeraldas TaxID=1808958 RepID=A0AAW0F4P6_9TRYP
MPASSSSPAPSPRPPAATAIDSAAFDSLVRFLPADLRGLAETHVAEACELHVKDRHFDAVRKVEVVLHACRRALLRNAPPLVEPPAASAVRPAAAAAPPGEVRCLPTALAIALVLRFLETSELYQVSCARARICDDLTRDIRNDAGWRLVSDHGDGDGTYYRFDDANNAHYFKVRGTVAVSVLYVCSILMELDLYSQWFPFCRTSLSQGEVSRFFRSAYMLVGAPWPFASRDVFMLGMGVDDLEDRDRILIVAHSVPFAGDAPRKTTSSTPALASSQLPPGVVAPARAKGSVVCDIIYTGFEIKMISPTETRLSFLISVDPKVPNIPQSALNWMSGKVMWQMLISMQTAAQKAMRPDSKYYQRRRQRPDVYELLRCRYNEMLRRKFPTAAYAAHALPEDY